MLLVSTLDGGLSALDAQSCGRELWAFRPGELPLVSQSLSALEVSFFFLEGYALLHYFLFIADSFLFYMSFDS